MTINDTKKIKFISYNDRFVRLRRCRWWHRWFVCEHEADKKEKKWSAVRKKQRCIWASERTRLSRGKDQMWRGNCSTGEQVSGEIVKKIWDEYESNLGSRNCRQPFTTIRYEEGRETNQNRL
ncbi:hypothetical protein PBCV1_a218L [Paramecium bursaria Chlorella virus 1]|uniref:Uncharacterized protein n=1 Tax=Paramecium bursaria Chlorella virus 1 TaxID=10506 RepID=Q84538_PBCV1|nr:hypothetical protein PBCV1_a218L [Paramecium bursaria Chlorella virus 1]AAC96586.1 hypothetical protein [Paramecium bursaria Chlorella virus 1]